MNQYECFSNVTQTYLRDFERILNNMIRQIEHVRMTNSISRNFISQMIPHHQAAIAMTKNILRYTTDIKLQCLAESIIQQQTQGIAALRRIAGPCGMHTNCREDLIHCQEEMNRILSRMYDEMQNVKCVNDINENFLREMIPHHLGAVAMSENALRFSLCSQLIPILENIITAQKSAVEQMQRMLEEGGDCTSQQSCRCGCSDDRGQHSRSRGQNCNRGQNCGQNRECASSQGQNRDQNRECASSRGQDCDQSCECSADCQS